MYSKDNLAAIKRMNILAPDVMKSFRAFDKAALADGAIPMKHKELRAGGAVTHATHSLPGQAGAA